jgi:hypothetical protein
VQKFNRILKYRDCCVVCQPYFTTIYVDSKYFLFYETTLLDFKISIFAKIN